MFEMPKFKHQKDPEQFAIVPAMDRLVLLPKPFEKV
jgi:hypothetical protein